MIKIQLFSHLPGPYKLHKQIVKNAKNEMWTHKLNKDISKINENQSTLYSLSHIPQTSKAIKDPISTGLEATQFCAWFYETKKDTVDLNDPQFDSELKEWFVFCQSCSEFLKQENISY